MLYLRRAAPKRRDCCMRRSPLLPLLILVTALAGACGGGSSGGSSSATVPQGAVAVVGDREVTVSDLNHLIQVRLSALKQQNTKLPKAGTDAYNTQVVQPLVGFLVFQAQVHNIAKQ